MIIGSYYTTDTPYAAEAERLKKSLDGLGLSAQIIGCPDRKDWQRNVQWRPTIILRLLNLYEEDVLFVDADATFSKKPDEDYLIGLDCDFAAHVMDKQRWGQDTTRRKYSLMAGTLFVKNNDASRDLMDAWARACATSNGKEWDMRILERLVGFNPHTGRTCGQWNFAILPETYCAIDRTMPSVPSAVIRHHQASRRLKQR